MTKVQEIELKKSVLMIKAEKLSAIKKSLYSNIDIESPMSIEEKNLNSEIANIYSDINTLVKLKRLFA